MSEKAAAIVRVAQKSRIFVSRVMVGLLFPLLLITPLTWTENDFLGFVVETLGFFLIIVGAFGRVWASLYVAGKKGKRLVTTGPYSICRNPLYVSSLLIGLGIVAAFQNLLLVIPLVLFHLGCYFFTILAEERELVMRFGDEYESYRKAVPRLFPAFSRYRRGADTNGCMLISEGRVLRCLFESALFALIIVLAEFIEQLHTWGLLPLLLRH
jgi:protein-S-isoprenylcysteine O-methyltransferase Ste14